MSFRRLSALAATVCAALLLSGCFVVTKYIPAGSGPINDDRLVGTWIGVDNEGNTPSDTAFLHFQKPDPAKPLRLVWVEDKSYQVYDLTTTHIGSKDVFAARLIAPPESKEKDIPNGYYVGFYEVKGDEIVFSLLDGEKVGKLIERGKVEGIKPAGKYEMASLTGSPTDLARFLASPEAAAAVSEEPARVRRLQTATQK